MKLTMLRTRTLKQIEMQVFSESSGLTIISLKLILLFSFYSILILSVPRNR